jgi:hypothetical protein
VAGNFRTIEDLTKSIMPERLDRILDTYIDYLLKRDEYKEYATKIKEEKKKVKKLEHEYRNTRINLE